MHPLVVGRNPPSNEQIPGMDRRQEDGSDEAQNEPRNRPSSHSGAQHAPRWDGARQRGGAHPSARDVRHATPRVDWEEGKTETMTREKSRGALEILCLWARVLLALKESRPLLEAASERGAREADRCALGSPGAAPGKGP